MRLSVIECVLAAGRAARMEGLARAAGLHSLANLFAACAAIFKSEVFS